MSSAPTLSQSMLQTASLAVASSVRSASASSSPHLSKYSSVSSLELQKKVHPKVRNHGEGPY